MGCRHSLHRVSIGPVTVQIDSFINQASRATIAICPAKQQRCLQLWPLNWPHIYIYIWTKVSAWQVDPFANWPVWTVSWAKFYHLPKYPKKLTSSVHSYQEWPRKHTSLNTSVATLMYCAALNHKASPTTEDPFWVRVSNRFMEIFWFSNALSWCLKMLQEAVISGW